VAEQVVQVAGEALALSRDGQPGQLGARRSQLVVARRQRADQQRAHAGPGGRGEISV